MAVDGPVAWGFIGAGGVARRRMLPAVGGHPEVTVAAVMVRDQRRAECLAEEFGAGAAYDSTDSLLADPAVEAVYIATPPHVHGEQVEAAARAGKHILLEKPMALDVATCDRMLAAVAEAGVELAVCFPLRHTGALQLLRAWLVAGELGELVYLRAQLAKWYPLDAAAWRADPAQSGGGVIMDLGSHLLDLAAWLGGEVESVGAVASRMVWDVTVEDTALITVAFASGAQAVLEVSFAVHDSRNMIELYGTSGYALAPSPRERGTVCRRSVNGEEEAQPETVNVYQRELLDFGAALRGGGSPATSGADGRLNVACLAAAYRAAERGGRERVKGA